ncbi:MAG TPA: methyltransferase [Polyangiaceae bacterium]|nr:methyltransferase [Polyangiaceae bacterium]
MRYGASPSNLLEWLAFALGQVPLPVLDTIVPLLQARALMAAAEHGVLDAIAERARTSADLGLELGLDAECVGLVLRVLQAMGYVAGDDGSWTLTSTGARHFGKGAAQSFDAFVRYGPAQYRMIDRIDDVLRTGKGIDFHDHHTPQEWTAYQRAMLDNARGFAWFVRDHLPVPGGAKSCLDIAGAHGMVGAELCRKHPPMRATVLDRPEALATARSIAEAGGWTDVVTFREGNLLHDDFGADVDVVLLCNVLHHFDASTNALTLTRVRRAMKPGAVVGIFDIEPPEPHAAPDASADALALYFRITSTSTCFRGRDFVEWLSAAGFHDARIVRSVKMPSRVLVHARNL